MNNHQWNQKNFHSTADTKRFFNRLRNPFIKTKENYLAKRIGAHLIDSKNRILEVGCGEGSNLMFLKEVFPKGIFWGIDFSLEKVTFMKRWEKDMHSVCGNAISLPFKDNMFDLVLIRDLLHHVYWAKELAISEALRVVKPEGVVIIFESNGNKMINRIFRRLFPVERGMSESTPDKLQMLIAKYGEIELEFVEASFLVRAIAFLGGWPQGIGRYLLIPLYGLALIWEIFCAAIVPKRFWTYMMITLEREEP